MSEQQTAYRQIMKATSIFGGVQVFTIIISIIRTKFIAVLLGPIGMGISGLLTSTIGVIAGLTNLGLSISAVKDISEAYNTGNQIRISIIEKVLKRLVWITGILGAIITSFLSPMLSEITFGNTNYTFAFIWISITLLLNQISIGQSVLLRGMRKIKYLAKATTLGSTIGLITTVPLYYFLGIKGIVPGIILTSVTSLMLTWHFANKLNINNIFVSKARTIAEGKGMIKMGFMVSLSGLITLGASYIVRIYISNVGGVDQVGLYNAGFAIINTYVGMIFTAMGTDYYPRLAAVSNNNKMSTEAINQQAEIALLILSPIIIVFLVYINWVIIILYSQKFIAINSMIYYAALGMFFKTASWAIAFIFLAKGASKLFFWNELITNIYLLALNILGYKLWGLTGLGISFMVSYMLYLIQVFSIAKYKYQFSFTNESSKLFLYIIIMAVACFLIVKFLSTTYAYLFGSIIILISAIFSYRELDKRIDLRTIISTFKNRH